MGFRRISEPSTVVFLTWCFKITENPSRKIRRIETRAGNLGLECQTFSCSVYTQYKPLLLKGQNIILRFQTLMERNHANTAVVLFWGSCPSPSRFLRGFLVPTLAAFDLTTAHARTIRQRGEFWKILFSI